MAVRPTQQFVKGQTIVLEGSPGDRTFKIISGEVLVCKQNSYSDLVPIAKLGPGEIFGEMYLFSGSNTRSATVIAASSDVEVEIYFHEEMQTMIRRLSPAMASIMHGFSHRLRMTSGRCAEMHHETRVTKLPDGTVRQNGNVIQHKQG